MQHMQQFRYWQRAWQQADLRLPLRCGVLLLALLLATLATHLPWAAGAALLGFFLLAAQQGYDQPRTPLPVAVAIAAPLFVMPMLLAVLLADERGTAIWLAIAVFVFLLCLAGTRAGAWLQARCGKTAV